MMIPLKPSSRRKRPVKPTLRLPGDKRKSPARAPALAFGGRAGAKPASEAVSGEPPPMTLRLLRISSTGIHNWRAALPPLRHELTFAALVIVRLGHDPLATDAQASSREDFASPPGPRANGPLARILSGCHCADEPTARCSISLPRTEGWAVMDKQPVPIGEQIITIVLLVIFALVIWYGAMI